MWYLVKLERLKKKRLRKEYQKENRQKILNNKIKKSKDHIKDITLIESKKESHNKPVKLKLIVQSFLSVITLMLKDLKNCVVKPLLFTSILLMRIELLEDLNRLLNSKRCTSNRKSYLKYAKSATMTYEVQ